MQLLSLWLPEHIRCVPKQIYDCEEIKFASKPSDIKHIIFLLFNNTINSLSFDILIAPCLNSDTNRRRQICELTRRYYNPDKHGEYYQAISETIIDSSYYYDILKRSDDEIKGYIKQAVDESNLIGKITKIVEEFSS